MSFGAARVTSTETEFAVEAIARGPNFVYAREWIQEEHGQDAWQRVLDALPPEAASLWGGALLAGNLYSFALFKEIVPALTKAVGGQSDRELAQMYMHIADRSLNKIYKVFFRATRPSFVIGNYPKLWARFFTEGSVEVPEATKEKATLVFHVPEIFLDWLPPACLGFSSKAVEMAGGRSLKMEEKEKARQTDGSWRVTYALSWKEG